MGWPLGFRFWGFGLAFRVQGLGALGWPLGFRTQDLRLWAGLYGSGFRAEGGVGNGWDKPLDLGITLFELRRCDCGRLFDDMSKVVY